MKSKDWIKIKLSSNGLTLPDRVMLEQVLQDLERLEAIDNANPSEALERYHNGDVLVPKADSRFEDEYLVLEDEEEYKILKEALLELKLLKAQRLEKELKAFKIINEKEVDIWYLRFCFNCGGLERYNRHAQKHHVGTLKKEEFNALKEVFEND